MKRAHGSNIHGCQAPAEAGVQAAGVHAIAAPDVAL